MSLTDLTGRKHLRALHQALHDAGFDILQVKVGRHYRIQVRKTGQVIMLTMACSPRNPEHAVINTMKQAHRAIRQAREREASRLAAAKVKH